MGKLAIPLPSQGPATVTSGKYRRRPAKGAEHARRVAFGQEWGAYARQVSQELRRERER